VETAISPYDRNGKLEHHFAGKEQKVVKEAKRYFLDFVGMS